METLAQRFELIDRHIARAVDATTTDRGASPITLAVLLEFQKKSAKARTAIASGKSAREAVIEVEQAADSAVVAADADRGAAPDTRNLIDLAHRAICLLKREM